MDAKKALFLGKELFLHIFFPKVCFHCGRDLPMGEKAPLCRECIKKLRPVSFLQCKRCGRELKEGGAFCFDCRGSKAAKYKCKTIRAALHFTPELRSLVHAFKYKGHEYLADFFTPYMTAMLRNTKEFEDISLIIPVPLHPVRHRSRGYNQALLLANALGESCGVPVAQPLVRHRYTKSQAKLGRKERKENIKDAFKSGVSLKGKKVLLIDDVATTTATLEACARAVHEAGGKAVALTLARE